MAIRIISVERCIIPAPVDLYPLSFECQIDHCKMVIINSYQEKVETEITTESLKKRKINFMEAYKAFIVHDRLPDLHIDISRKFIKRKTVTYQSFVNPVPMGPGIVGHGGLKCHLFWPQHHPRSAVELWGFWFHAQTNLSYFRLSCQNLSRLSRAFGRALTIKMSRQCWTFTWALQRKKSISLLFTIGAVVTNDKCIMSSY